MDTQKLAVYIGRGKVILKDREKCECPKKQCDCLIDSEEPINKLFVEKNMVAPSAREPDEVKKPEKRLHGAEESDSLGHGESIHTLQKKKLSGQITELENKNKLYEGKIQKIYEEIIPREHASYLIKNYSLGIKDVWLTATDRFLQQKSNELGLTREEIIKHRDYINEICNDAIRQGAERAIQNIKKLATEFAGKKYRGERDD